MRTRDEDIAAIDEAVERLKFENEVGHFETTTEQAELNMLKAQVRLLILHANAQAPITSEAFALLRESIE